MLVLPVLRPRALGDGDVTGATVELSLLRHRVPLNELRWMTPPGSVHWVKSGPVVAVVRLSEVRSHFA